FSRYVTARRHADPSFDANAFARLYATLAAQRATKILGIFARLDRRDHKPQYLRHMPRVWNYLRRALAHPALQALDAWYLRNVPPPGCRCLRWRVRRTRRPRGTRALGAR